MKLMKLVLSALACVSALAACSSDSTGPDDRVSIAVQAGDAQFGTRGAALSEPLQVIVTDPVSRKPRTDVQVEWRVTEGTGATLSATTTQSDSKGVASITLTLGSQLGTYRIEAISPKLVGAAAKFSARAVEVPLISGITPSSAVAGDTVTLTGQNFSPTADENIVLFGGFRAKVTSASTTQLRAVVPLCVPTRSLPVQTALGAVSSNQVNVFVTANSASALQLSRGQVRSFTDPNELACFRLPGGVSGLSLLLMPQNSSQIVGSFASIQLAGLTGGQATSMRLATQPFVTRSSGDDWELLLRRRERALLRGPAALARPQPSSIVAACPAAQLGARCDFQVINKKNEFEAVTAEVKAITTRAVVYQDIKAPANGLTTADFQSLGTVFDDPIYATDVATFGSPSDLDSNGKVIILLTPVVNTLTDRGASGFIAGFFYGCDLLSRSACGGSNQAEMFYALVADPAGQFSDNRTRDVVMRSLPPVLAHEFQHMINFSQRGNSTDALWLSEGMAHHAEDVVGDVFEARGDAQNALTFKQQNYTRANRYLRATASTSLLAEEDVGTLELRGAAWLFVKYLAGQFGNEILARLTRSTQSSVNNVTTQTGRPWNTLLSDWGVALWADDAPELAGATLNPAHTFQNINLRQKVANSDGSYPLKPTVFSFEDFLFKATLPASSQTYVMVQATGALPSLNLNFSGQFGGTFATNAVPQMTVLRIK